jgi:phage shock protein PspC (stress-responsive transcriptional regulator)
MQNAQALFTEDQTFSPDEPDSLFGVCQTIGEELGFNPFYLRFALLGLLFFSPVAVIATYAALGGVVALSRWLFPTPHAAVEPIVEHEQQAVREPELIAA